MTTREQVEAEAEEHVRGTDNGPDGYHGFIAGRTVTAEQVQAVARVLDGQNGNLFNEEALAEDALDAAGLLIEGDDQ